MTAVTTRRPAVMPWDRPAPEHDVVDGATPRVAVVGGGIAGLSAAVTLADAGASVVVLDADRLGGKLRTGRFAGRPVEEGADAFLARVPDARDLAVRVGLADDLVAPATGRASVWVEGALVPLPVEHVLGVPADPDAADLRALLDDAAIARLRDDVASPGARPAADDDPTIGAFIRARLGDAVADRLVGPLVGGINAGNIDALSLAAVTPQIDHLARSGDDASLVRAAARARAAAPATGSAPVFLAPRDGMASLVAAVVDHLRTAGVELHDGVAVRSLERLTGAPRGAWRVVADQPRRTGIATEVTFEVDAVVVAAPAPVAGLLVQDHAPEAGAHLASIAHASVAVATFAFPTSGLPDPMEGSGFLVARAEDLLCTAATWLSTKWARLAPEAGDGTFLIRASAGRADDRRIAELGDDAVVERLADEVMAVSRITDAPVETQLRRWPSALPQYAPGHLERIAAVEAELASLSTPLAVAGCALRGVGIPASIASGRRAAERVLASMSDR